MSEANTLLAHYERPLVVALCNLTVIQSTSNSAVAATNSISKLLFGKNEEKKKENGNYGNGILTKYMHTIMIIIA